MMKKYGARRGRERSWLNMAYACWTVRFIWINLWVNAEMVLGSKEADREKEVEL